MECWSESESQLEEEKEKKKKAKDPVVVPVGLKPVPHQEGKKQE